MPIRFKAKDIKKILMILTCLSIIGCASTFENKRLKGQIAQIEEANIKKYQDIERLKKILEEKEGVLKERNLKIESLRKKLEGFGVFE